MKVCSRCSIQKSRDQFTADRQKKDGLCSYCRDCYQIYYAAVRSTRLAKKKEYREANRQAISAYRVEHYARNRQHQIGCALDWAKSNPIKRRVNESARRARMKGSEGRFTKADLLAIVESQKWKCVVCRTSLRDGYHADHIQPLVSGGSNDKYNIQALCPACNCSKRAKDPQEFMQSRGYLL